MSKFLIRLFDFIFSFLGLIILLPLFLIISFCIAVSSPGGVFFRQKRVGKDNTDFILWKFRTMESGADKNGLLTVGKKDSRVTRIGYFLRKYKLDELPQLLHVLTGDMSLVGPRPEVRKYVDLYTPDQKKVLTVKPGITDIASIEYANENELLGRSVNPEMTYVEEIMPAKILLNMKFIEQPTIKNYFLIILNTLVKIIG